MAGKSEVQRKGDGVGKVDYLTCWDNNKSTIPLPCPPFSPKGPTMHWLQQLGQDGWHLSLDQAEKCKANEVYVAVKN